MTLSGQTIRTAPAERMRVTAVLLDLDGTLVASNDAHAKAWVDVLEDNGFNARFEDVRPSIGMGGGLLLERVTGIAPHDPRGVAIQKARSAIFRERYLAEVTPQPGARTLVEKLKKRGFKTIVATSASDATLRPLLEVAEIADLVDGCTSADDVELAKPVPDLIHAALKLAGCNPDHAILIGDTPYDISTGRAAGVAVIALRCGGWDDDALDGAVEVFDDPADLLQNWMQTPFRASLADLDAPL